MNLKDFFLRPSLSLVGQINPDMAKQFIKDARETLKTAQEMEQPALNLVISTGGGNVQFAMAMYETVRLLSKLVRIDAVVVGNCLSAGLWPLLAVPKEQRFATANSWLMIHQMHDDREGRRAGPLSAREVVLSETKVDLDSQRRLQNWMARLLAKETELPMQQARECLEIGKWWTAKEAVKIGLVAELVQEK